MDGRPARPEEIEHLWTVKTATIREVSKKLTVAILTLGPWGPKNRQFQAVAQITKEEYVRIQRYGGQLFWDGRKAMAAYDDGTGIVYVIP